MPDNVIDSLSIRIGASVSQSLNSINTLQESLEKLNRVLANFSDTGTYKQALDNMASGFNSLNGAITNFDVEKIERSAKALKTLSSAASGIEKAFGNSSALGRTVSETTQSFKEQGKTIATEFGIKGTRNINAVTEAFSELAQSAQKSGRTTQDYQEKLNSLIATVREFADVSDMVGKETDSMAKQIRQYVSDRNKSGSKVYLPFNPSEFRDEFRQMRATFGNMFTTDDFAFFEGAQDIVSFAREMNDTIGSTIRIDTEWAGGNAADIFRQIYEYLVQSRNEQENLVRSAQNYYVTEQDVIDVVDQLLPKLQELSTVGNVDGEGGANGNGLTALTNSLKSLVGLQLPDFTQLKDLASAVKSLGSDSAVKGSSSLEPIVNALTVFGNGITIPDFENLKGLASAMQSLGSATAQAGATNLKPVLDSLKSLNSIVAIPDFSNLKTLATSMQSLGNNNAQNATWVIPNIMAELESFAKHFSGLTLDMTAIDTVKQLGSAFSKLGGKNVTSAIQNLPQLSIAIRQMIDDLNSMPQVNKETQELVVALGQLSKAKVNATNATSGFRTQINLAQKAIDWLTKKIQGLLKDVNLFKTGINLAKSGIESLGHSITSSVKNALTSDNILTKLKNTVGSLGVAFIKLRGIIWGFKMVANMFNSLVANASSLVEVQNVVRHVYDPSYIEEFNNASENTITTLGLSKLSFQQFASRYQAMGKALGITNVQMAEAEDHLKNMGVEYGSVTGKMGDMSVNLTRLAGDMASFYDVDVESVQKSLQAVYTGQTRPLRQYGIDLTQATLQEWAMKHGIDANIDSMTQAEKTILRYQYTLHSARAAMNDFARTSDRMCVA